MDAARLGREPVAALLGPQVLGHPGDAVAGTLHGELQRGRGLGTRAGEVGLEPVLSGVLPGQPAVERERDRIQDRALARPRGAFEQEEAAGGQLVEVDPVRRRVRAERLDLQDVQPHQAATSARRAASTACLSTAS